jgi:hypothetical protein
MILESHPFAVARVHAHLVRGQRVQRLADDIAREKLISRRK